MAALKPQDVYVMLKLAADDRSRSASYSHLALELGMSASEVHASVRRARASGLLHGPDLGMGRRPNVAALEEFLVHGLKYVFPAERGELSRGVATSYGAAPVRQLISSPKDEDPIPVWPCAEGRQRGASLAPLHKSAPLAALRDESFYQLLVLADALRDGRARERRIATTELRNRMQQLRQVLHDDDAELKS